MIKIVVHRHALTEDQRRRLQAVLPKQKAGLPATLGDRLFIEAVRVRVSPSRSIAHVELCAKVGASERRRGESGEHGAVESAVRGWVVARRWWRVGGIEELEMHVLVGAQGFDGSEELVWGELRRRELADRGRAIGRLLASHASNTTARGSSSE